MLINNNNNILLKVNIKGLVLKATHNGFGQHKDDRLGLVWKLVGAIRTHIHNKGQAAVRPNFCKCVVKVGAEGAKQWSNNVKATWAKVVIAWKKT
jgi:hypothetical protein